MTSKMITLREANQAFASAPDRSTAMRCMSGGKGTVRLLDP
jgi:hypothetical protein